MGHMYYGHAEQTLFLRTQMNLKRCWNHINLLWPVENQKFKKCVVFFGLFVCLWSEREDDLSVKSIFGLAQSLRVQYKRDVKPDHMPLSAPFITTWYLILKGDFSLITRSSSIEFPQEKICCCCLLFPLRQRSEVGLVPCSWAFPHEWCLISHGLETEPFKWRTASPSHHSAFFDSLFHIASYLILKGYFSLIFIMLVFLHYRASNWTWLSH